MSQHTGAGVYRRVSLTCLLLALTAGSRSMTCGAEDATPAAPPQTLKEYIAEATEWYEVFPSAAAAKPARVLPTLRWVNNVRGSDDGVTVLYVHEGLPVAAACVFPWRKKLYHTFESLSRGKVLARRDGETIWEPESAGVTFADVPDAPVPEIMRPARLRQMKALAQQFDATMRVTTASGAKEEELRLLPTPLFRYDPKACDVVDGCVFAFVTGTDPEALLLLEAVKAGEKTRWQYAFARRTYGQLICRYDRAVVWDVPQYPPQDDPHLPHYTRGVELPPEIADEQARLEKMKPPPKPNTESPKTKGAAQQ